ncbi:MAG: class I SAM-dependent methyltransferase, partial [Chitinophagaceae bacterium]|nr:class I SAM-dependent methyltransferase [Chitinophagaceae bacterium]
HYDSCPVCYSTAISRAITAVDHTVSNKSFEIWQCSNCSLRFTQDVPGPEEIGAYYKSENYISHTETKKGIVNSLYLQVRRFTLAGKRKLIEKITGVKRGTLLDIGAGTGAFVNYMSEAGWKAEGLEPDDEAIKRAAAVHGIQLKPSSELFNLSPASYDAITMWHVLEHVHDLHAYIEQLKKLIRPSGRIFIAVPNYTSYDADHYSSSWAAYDVPRHLYHFSPASMKVLMTEHGLRIDAIKPMWFDSFYVSLLSEKYLTGSSSLFKGFWNGFRSNRHAVSNPRRASSLIYIIS